MPLHFVTIHLCGQLPALSFFVYQLDKLPSLKIHVAHMLDTLCHLLHILLQDTSCYFLSRFAPCLTTMQLQWRTHWHDALTGHNAVQGHNSMCSAGRLNAACYGCWGHGVQLWEVLKSHCRVHNWCHQCHVVRPLADCWFVTTLHPICDDPWVTWASNGFSHVIAQGTIHLMLPQCIATSWTVASSLAQVCSSY